MAPLRTRQPPTEGLLRSRRTSPPLMPVKGQPQLSPSLPIQNTTAQDRKMTGKRRTCRTKTIANKWAACLPTGLPTDLPTRVPRARVTGLTNEGRLTARVEEGVRHHANQVLHEVEQVPRRSRPRGDHDLGRLPRVCTEGWGAG